MSNKGLPFLGEFKLGAILPMAIFRAPRGVQDILPQSAPVWVQLQSTARAICERYGFAFIETPIFEEAALFVRGVGAETDIVQKEMYTFEDRGGVQLTLRPEFTAGIMRAYIEHGMHTWPQPVKLYSLGPAFRYERPQAGRFRQFHQFNIEAIGEPDPLIDAEVILLMWRYLQELGLNRLNLQLNSIGCPACRPPYVEALKSYYSGLRRSLCSDCQERLHRNPLRLLDCKAASCQALLQEAPRSVDFLCPSCAGHFQELRLLLEAAELPYELNPRLVRGLDYYTKTVFEIWAEGIGAQNAVCGGGRYDGLAEALGFRSTPGVGAAAGLERLLMLLQGHGQAERPSAALAVFIPLAGPARPLSLKLAEELRLAGLPAQCTYGDRSLKAQLKSADRLGAQYAIILGEDELAHGQATVRCLGRSEQVQVPLARLVDWLKEQAAVPAGERAVQ